MSTALAYDPVRRPPARPNPITAAPAPAPAPAPVPEPAPVASPRTAGAAAPAAVPRSRVVVAAALIGAAACLVGAQLVLSIGTAQGAYEAAALQQRSAALDREQQAQQEALRALAAPQRLAAGAAALGMVPDDSPAYLDAATGRVLGSATTTKGTAAAPAGIVR